MARWDDGRFHRCTIVEAFDDDAYFVQQVIIKSFAVFAVTELLVLPQIDRGEEEMIDGSSLFMLPPSLGGIDALAMHCSLQGYEESSNAAAMQMPASAGHRLQFMIFVLHKTCSNFFSSRLMQMFTFADEAHAHFTLTPQQSGGLRGPAYNVQVRHEKTVFHMENAF